MRTFLRLFSLVVTISFLLTGCGRQDDTVAPQSGKDEVVVHLSAGDAATTAASESRSTFSENKPVTVFVYQRDDNNKDVAQYSELYKRVSGVVTRGGTGGLSTVNVSGGSLTVEPGHSYDFVLVVNLPSNATVSNGVISGITNGADIMVGRCDNKEVTETASSVDVFFRNGYASEGDGNLPHLASKVVVNASADQTLLDNNKASGIKMGVMSAEFYDIQGKASLNFGSTPMGLTMNGSVSSYKLVNSDLADVTPLRNLDKLTTVTTTADVATYDKGTLLPMPLAAGTTRNVMDIDFTVNVNGYNSLLSAKNVEVPEFKSGYQYTFNVVMKGAGADAAVDLYLSVKPWNSVSWESGMGGDDNGEQTLYVKVGSWTSASWSTVMGGDDSNGKTYILTGVQGWSSSSWSINMGGTNSSTWNNEEES